MWSSLLRHLFTFILLVCQCLLSPQWALEAGHWLQDHKLWGGCQNPAIVGINHLFTIHVYTGNPTLTFMIGLDPTPNPKPHASLVGSPACRWRALCHIGLLGSKVPTIRWRLRCAFQKWWLPSLKLTEPLKIDGWNTSFIMRRPIFRGYVSFREGMVQHDISLGITVLRKRSAFRSRNYAQEIVGWQGSIRWE